MGQIVSRAFQSLMCLAAMLVPTVGRAESPASANSMIVEDMVALVIDAVSVPAEETGVIAEISAREGNLVVAGQELGTLDDRRSLLAEQLAQTELQIAQEKLEHGMAVELAAKQLERQQQLAKQHAFVREIAAEKAQNQIRTLASKKAEEVARNELDRATAARRRFVDSVSGSEIDGLQLAYEKTKLETQQADFERRIDELRAAAESEAATEHMLGVEHSEIEYAQAQASARIDRLGVELREQKLRQAKLATRKHKIICPLNGVVVERIRQRGDWVTAGDPVIRVIRLDRLRAEGFVDAERIEALRSNREVELQIEKGVDSWLERDGSIVFISPEIDPVNRRVRFWVEFENPDLDVLPGMRVKMSAKP